jgi:hypothetical protein
VLVLVGGWQTEEERSWVPGVRGDLNIATSQCSQMQTQIRDVADTKAIYRNGGVSFFFACGVYIAI